MANKRLWKSMKAGMTSAHGDVEWRVGEWYTAKGKIEACKNGFHASKNVIDAMGFVSCEVLALVEVKGKNDKEKDKYAYEQMKIVKAWHWKKEDSVALSIFAAELCIENFEKVFPDDKRPREAIEAAKRWLDNPTEENRRSAESAAESAAESVWSARSSAVSSAWSAVWSARSAAWSARSAVVSSESAWSAVWSARSAAVSARSARSAVWSAVRSAARSAARFSNRAKKKILKQCHDFVIKRTEKLEKYDL